MKNTRVYIQVSKSEKSILEPSIAFFFLSFFFSLSFPHSHSRLAPLSLTFSTALHQFEPPLATVNHHRRGPTPLLSNPTKINPNNVISLHPPCMRAPGSPSLARLVLARLAHTTLGPKQALASSICDQCTKPCLSRTQSQTRRDLGAPSDR